MRRRAYPVTTTAFAALGVTALFALRFVGAYSHQALVGVLVVGLVWAAASRGWRLWKGRLYTGLPRAFRERTERPILFQAVGRASFWTATAAACLAVFPRSEEMLPVIAGVAGIAVLRIAASFLPARQANNGPTWVMVAGAVVLVLDLGRAFLGGPAAVAVLAPPFKGEWLVIQGGRSPLQNLHLAAYNQRFALDLLHLRDGRVFGDAQGNAGVHSWEQQLTAPADGTVVAARDDMDDAEGASFVTNTADVAGNTVVIELDSGHFVVLAHLRRGTLQVRAGDRVRRGDPLARVGNTGNTSLPHLHLQVQTHADIWDPDNRSLPFGFEPHGRVPARNDRVGTAG